MPAESRPAKPRGFGLMTRIIFVHQAICFALFLSGLRLSSAGGISELVAHRLLGIVVSLAIVLAIYGVANRKSPKALPWLRVFLWIGVVKILVVQLWLLAQGDIGLTSYARAILLNELVAIPVAVYWSRPVHARYLSSLGHAAGSSVA